jgi:hypothetical protein
MTDYFALLSEPRRPWLEADSLKAKFLSLSAVVHPDKVHGATDAERRAAHERYIELNAAYNCLREPRERLRHLLQLELGRKPAEVQEVPSAAMDLFVEVAKACRDADSFLGERMKVTSPLLKVQMFQRAQERIEMLKALQQHLGVRRDGLFKELKRMDAFWESTPNQDPPGASSRLPLARLEEIYRALSFMTRWTDQIQERLAQLAE